MSGVFTEVFDGENAYVWKKMVIFSFWYTQHMIIEGPKCVACAPLCSLRSVGDCQSWEGNTAAVSLCGVFAVILLLMTYSFACLHSGSLENNEGVCCINLCNGEREWGAGWWKGGTEGGGERREEWWAHAAALQLLYTHSAPLWSLSREHMHRCLYAVSVLWLIHVDTRARAADWSIRAHYCGITMKCSAAESGGWHASSSDRNRWSRSALFCEWEYGLCAVIYLHRCSYSCEQAGPPWLLLIHRLFCFFCDKADTHYPERGGIHVRNERGGEGSWDGGGVLGGGGGWGGTI